jgi:hypothetical protein
MSAGTASPRINVRAAPRSAADVSMRRLLRVPEGGPRASEDDAHRLFSASIVLSGLRCLLGYVLFPIVLPAIGAAASVGPAIGLPVGLVALVFDVRGIRRFWLADHRWRWPITGLYAAVMTLVTVLVVGDVVHLAR